MENLSIRDLLTANKTTILEALKRHEIITAYIEYQGCGDSGAMTAIGVMPDEKQACLDETVAIHCFESSSDGTSVNVVVAEMTLGQALEDFSMEWLEKECAGWEIDGGAQGTITLSVDNGNAEMDHTTFYTESNNEVFAI